MRRDTLLVAAVVATGAFGAALVLLPGLTRQGFGLLLYGDATRLDGFGAEARAYVTLLHGVLGAVMIGWAVALGALLRGRWRVPGGSARPVVAWSIGVWYVVDTIWSLAQGAWQNALLNSLFALVFAIALRVARGADQGRAG